MIIVDDGSTDARVVKYLDQFTKQTNEPITVMRLPQNKGLPEALNTGIQIALELNADFIARMDADDISVPERFEMQMNFFNRNPSVDILGSNVLIFND